MREGRDSRQTKETQISLYLNLDSNDQSIISTGIGFFDHMLDLFTYHSGIQVDLEVTGDLEVCDHHTVEDVGILLGKLFAKALGDKRGIRRYGSFTLPMDETLASCTLDLSGRAYLVFNCEFRRENLGTMSTEMVKEFFQAFAFNSGTTLHLNIEYGDNDHHKAEALFKAFGRAIREAIEIIGNEVPSTKGVLE